MVVKQSGKLIEVLRNNGSRVICVNIIKHFLEDYSIIHEITPYSHQHNGTLERKNISIINMVLKSKSLAKYLLRKLYVVTKITE